MSLDLKEYFLRGCKSASELTVGIEWEKLGIHRSNGLAISYSGDCGVEAILNGLVRNFSWKPEIVKGHIIALERDGLSITLEPGGQIELSGKNAKYLSENESELLSHLDEIRSISEPIGVAWLALGAQPFSTADTIEWVPKDRYAIMRQTLKGRGSQVYAMMKETASVQISLDFMDENDAIEKFRLALALAPVLTGVFANSPIKEGRPTEFLSRRSNIWSHTDPARTGVIWDVFSPEFGLDAYVEYALGVPLLFIQRDGQWIRVEKDMTFENYLKDGYAGLLPTEQDWELHLSSIFTEARLKTYIEFRSIDCQAPDLGLAAAALLKGLFYDKNARSEAWQLLSGYSVAERKALQRNAPKEGLKARLGNETILSLAMRLVAMAKNGLKEEGRFLAPLDALLRSGVCPARQLLLQCGESHDADRVREIILERCEI